ncbi:LAMI_0B00716g1_1 [Lachancea mirantina]|uniref:LAMI_0B00716g1_1 n=1 Tax=Lachancea mirantina TaxID=1230905 RepID=A0A1G4IT92_9SACH|nr:LAMI_0B00716g1_1 [Lachancea mirantina]
MDEKVIVTGASGFVASHIVNILLSERFHVIGTVRSKEKAEKLLYAFEHYYPYATLEVEIVPDIGVNGAFDALFKKHPDTQHVIHTACPVSLGEGVTLEQSYLIPAVHGTRNILEATQRLGKNVKHVVITSSFVAVNNKSRANDPDFINFEESWNPITWENAQEDSREAYAAAKKLAEQYAWDFYEKNKDELPWTLTSINPPLVFGPQIFEWGLDRNQLNFSAEMINSALKLPPDFEGPFDFPNGLCSDVRDVALVHMLPLRNGNLAGQRLIPICGTGLRGKNYEDGKWNLQRILEVIHKNFPELKGKVPVGKLQNNKQYLDKVTNYNNDITCRLTGIEFKHFETTVRDTVKQILEYNSSRSKT